MLTDSTGARTLGIIVSTAIPTHALTGVFTEAPSREISPPMNDARLIVEQIQQLTSDLAARQPSEDPPAFTIQPHHLAHLDEISHRLADCGFGLSATVRGQAAVLGGYAPLISGHLGLTVADAVDPRRAMKIPTGQTIALYVVGPHLKDVLRDANSLPMRLYGRDVAEFAVDYTSPSSFDGEVFGPARDPFEALLRTIEGVLKLALQHSHDIPWRGFKENTRIADYSYQGSYWSVRLFKGGSPQCTC